MNPPVLDAFHPVVRAWFESRFPNGPTEPQAATWPIVVDGNDVLVASPTGSGKTLTAFLVAINDMWVNPPTEKLTGPSVVYLSPLRALATDVQHNLLQPLEEMKQLGAAMGYVVPDIRVDVRTGDTSQNVRSQQKRNPANILVTTPESLYLLLTSERGRLTLRRVRTVIVDEIHALLRDKRGSHLTLSMERLERLVTDAGRPRPQRIGLSATQRPLELVASMLSGIGENRMPTVVDCTKRRPIELSIELPVSDLDSILSTEQFKEILDRLAEIIAAHRTTLIFVQSRRLAERMAHRLADVLGESGILDDAGLVVAAHHGSLSYERRSHVEARLRSGELRALVATASLELGIDVGPVEAVCQIGSPKTIATFLQRVGRANHHVGGVPRGHLFPLTRHELVEAVAVLDAVRSGELDTLEPPHQPLDILAQQIVAEVALRGEDSVDELFTMVRHAAPYRDLTRDTFDEVLAMSSRGIVTGHGPRGAHLHHDPMTDEVRPRRSAKLTAVRDGGSIPDTGDYKVVLDPEGITVGSLAEDFAIESSPGDVFLLGTHAWRVVRVETSIVRVVDARGAEPNAPFWFGESPGRSFELGEVVANLHDRLLEPLARRDAADARALLLEIHGVTEAAADQVVAYLSQGYSELGDLPTTDVIIVERFFDETESSHLVIHSPFGARVNRALGLALRKRFCVSFDFELQAAADDDAITIALGPHHSFALDSVLPMVRSHNITDVLTQAVLLLPMLQARWRWNVGRALVMSRTMAGGKRPIHLQRMEADDLLAATWPQLASCQENAPAGPISIPDHVLVTQTVKDVLSEPLDVVRASALLARVEAGEIRVRCVDSPTASILAHGIIHGRPFTFLDDAPAEERRTRAVATTRGTNARDGSGLPAVTEADALDRELVAALVAQQAPQLRSADELHDYLVDTAVIRSVEQWRPLMQQLVDSGRAIEEDGRWFSSVNPDVLDQLALDDEVCATVLRFHLSVAGPVTVEQLVGEHVIGAGPLRGAPVPILRARTAMALLESRGFAMQTPDGRWCARHLYARLNAQARRARRASYPTVALPTFVSFLTTWQHVAPGSKLMGREGLLEVVRQLQGFEAAAGQWEKSILPARIEGYQPEWLDELCLSGEITWARLTASTTPGDERGASSPKAATPLALLLRPDRSWQLRMVRLEDVYEIPDAGVAREIYDALREHGALFRYDLPELLTRLPAEIDEGMWDLVARGLVTADAFSALRSMLSARERLASRGRGVRGSGVSLSLQRAKISTGVGEGRWALLPRVHQEMSRLDTENMAEQVARQLILRYGIVSYELFQREAYRVAWRHVVWQLRRLEAQGEVVGGRFVDGLGGEQYAHPRVVQMLTETLVDVPLNLSACDPLNLSGSIVQSVRVPKRATQNMTIINGEISAS